ncbi:MAG: hypothetical protein FWD65_00840 [Coriobacteriia bacterium]|nr:hypothetical protein [Coriobacteriia bacterium]
MAPHQPSSSCRCIMGDIAGPDSPASTLFAFTSSPFFIVTTACFYYKSTSQTSRAVQAPSARNRTYRFTPFNPEKQEARAAITSVSRRYHLPLLLGAHHIGISYELAEILLEEFKSSLPSIEDIEAILKDE